MMMALSKKIILAAVVAAAVSGVDAVAATVRLADGRVALEWRSSRKGWKLQKVMCGGKTFGTPSAEHTVLFSEERPSDEPLAPETFGCEAGFPGEEYRYVMPSWREATTAVALNRAGEAMDFLPAKAEQVCDSVVRLSYRNGTFAMDEEWTLGADGDIRVVLELTALRDGWYSMATPSAGVLAPEEITYALIPGVLHGHAPASDFARAYAYGWDIPAEPVLYRERSTSTLTSMQTSASGVTLAVTAEPGTAAGPWGYDKRRTGAWRLGLSAMNRNGRLTPTLYHPVLGQEDSYMKAGENRRFAVRYTISDDAAGWWPVFNHVVYDIYRFTDGLALRHNGRSLTDRLYGIHRYVVNDSTSLWHTEDFNGTLIGAQEYLGGVYKAKKDAMKNADYGAMWMLGTLTADTLLTDKRMPYALNFKLMQQDMAPGWRAGASQGQYYLRNRREFVEEWGPYTEPIATTYYMLMDLGNIALFEPENPEVRERIRRAADWLLAMQHPEGDWAVAYADSDGSEAFDDLEDLRPTFYGLVIAYRLLGDEKYLAGARRGADRLIARAVDADRWLGVCGDTRFAPDFATIQAAQALWELHELTADKRYLDAAIRTARFYTTSVYTNPVATDTEVKVKGRSLREWQINPSGLSYEHGGIIGSTNLHGPILLASHAGMFVRMHRLTGDSLMLHMARAAAIGRDAFVDDETAVASYYWAAMNRGAGPYPHHAWWQMGWITDYLLAELELRSDGAVSFPAGFITPKVGPHRTFGFAPGKVYGKSARLAMIPGGATADNPDVETILACGDDCMYVMMLNDVAATRTTTLTLCHDALGTGAGEEAREITIEPYGLEILKIPYRK